MKQSHKLSDQQKIEIVEKYQTGNFTCKDLGVEYSVYTSSIARLLHRRNISVNNNQSQLQRKYGLNEKYFDIIDTEKKAYFLGLLYADGYHSESKKLFTINLQERDKDILEKFKEDIEFGGPLHFKEYKTKYPTWQNQFSLTIASPIISKALSNLGVMQAKSLILEFPNYNQVPEHLIRHFIRGYFDGDGSMSLWKNPKKKNSIQLTMSIMGTINFCQSCRILLENELKFNFQIIAHKSTKEITSLQTSGTQQVYKFLNWLYSNSSIYLDRKYNKFLFIREEIYNKGLISDFQYQPMVLTGL